MVKNVLNACLDLRRSYLTNDKELAQMLLNIRKMWVSDGGKVVKGLCHFDIRYSALYVRIMR